MLIQPLRLNHTLCLYGTSLPFLSLLTYLQMIFKANFLQTAKSSVLLFFIHSDSLCLLVDRLYLDHLYLMKLSTWLVYLSSCIFIFYYFICSLFLCFFCLPLRSLFNDYTTSLIKILHVPTSSILCAIVVKHFTSTYIINPRIHCY